MQAHGNSDPAARRHRLIGDDAEDVASEAWLQIVRDLGMRIVAGESVRDLRLRAEFDVAEASARLADCEALLQTAQEAPIDARDLRFENAVGQVAADLRDLPVAIGGEPLAIGLADRMESFLAFQPGRGRLHHLERPAHAALDRRGEELLLRPEEPEHIGLRDPDRPGDCLGGAAVEPVRGEEARGRGQRPVQRLDLADVAAEQAILDRGAEEVRPLPCDEPLERPRVRRVARENLQSDRTRGTPRDAGSSERRAPPVEMNGRRSTRTL